MYTSRLQQSDSVHKVVRKKIEDSLKYLRTDYLDLYLVHQVEDSVPLSETMRAMNRLVDEHIVKWIGGSNFAPSRFEKAQAYSDSKVVVNQVHYNLQIREPEVSGLLEYCQEHDVILTAWRPLQKGMLLNEVPEVVESVASKYGMTPFQLALSWLTSQKNVSAIVMSRNAGHLRENMTASEVVLASDDIERLRADYPGQKAISPTVPLL